MSARSARPNRGGNVAWDDVSRWQAVDLYASFRMGDAIQPIDVRDRGYGESETRIAKSVRIDPMNFETEIDALPTGRELIFYCDRPDEATSMRIALWASDHGRQRVGVLVGGWSTWAAAGYPIEPNE